ncbi:MAG: hypothetical protein PHV49_06800, partial [Alistipes sp.]|nr:hypothetical protein [Alistipes sp.]
MKLFIDGIEADLDPKTEVSISLGIASITKIETGRTGYSKTLKVPLTATNRRIFGDADQVHAADLFNRETHTAFIEVEGCRVMEGAPQLSRCETLAQGGGWYYLNLIGAGKGWVKAAAETMLRETEIDFEQTLTPAVVLQSWSWNQPVRFLPVQRDRLKINAESLNEGVRMLTFSDYHPFLHIKSVLDAIVQAAGYTIVSEFMNSDSFQSLYMSGCYPEKEVEQLANRMGFLAGRWSEASAVADRFGRVYADPFTTVASIGNLVDTADPTESASDGTVAEGVYNTNQCFRKVEGRIAFYPTEVISVGFEYALHYQSDFRIGTRAALTCFDRVYLDDNTEHCFKVMNRYEDRKAQFGGGWSYRFTYQQNGVTVTLQAFTSRSTLLSVPLGEGIDTPQLWILQEEVFQLYTEDWALYDGYIEETGTVEVELTVRSAASVASASNPRYFHRIHFGGAEEGMHLTVYRSCTLKPIFIPHPCEGSTVTFAEVGAHEIRQITLIQALKQLFNLYFYTDTLTRTLYIEPRESFYRNDVEVDWRDRIDLQKPIVVEEAGREQAQNFTLRYAEGDGSAARWDEAHKEIFGRWSVAVGDRFAQTTEQNYVNPLFTPTIQRT